MNKKKAIKIATASAIAASGFVAAAPAQTEASTPANVDYQVNRAKNVMVNAMYSYSKPYVNEDILEDRTVVYEAYKKGEAQYKYAVNYVNKYAKGTQKTTSLAKLETARKTYLLGRALNYIKSFNALELKVEPAAAKAEEAIADAKTVAEVEAAQAEFKKVFDAQQNDLKAVAESNIEATILEYAQEASDAVDTAADERKDELATVKEVSAVANVEVNEGSALPALPAKVGVTLSNGEKTEKAVTWNTSAVNTNVPATYTVKGDVEGTDLEASVNVVVKAVTPEVTSVKTLDAKTVEVKFNKAVQSGTATGGAQVVANYTLGTSTNPTRITLSEDKKTATLTFAAGFTADLDKYLQFKVENVKDAKGDAVTKYQAALFLQDKQAPTATATYSAPTATVTFSEALEIDTAELGSSASTKATVAVDGVPTTSYTIVNDNTSGDALTGAKAIKINGLSAGEHTISIVGAQDLAGNFLPEFSAKVNVGTDSVAPTVTSLTAEGNKIRVKFSEPLADATLNAQASKRVWLQSGAVNIYAAATDAVDEAGTEYLVDASAFVTAGNWMNVPVVVKAGSVDASANAIAADSTAKNLVISKDTAAPSVVSTTTKDDKIVVKFDEGIQVGTTAITTLDVKHTNADGVVVEDAVATQSGLAYVYDANNDGDTTDAGEDRYLVITVSDTDFVSGGKLKNGSYTVNLGAQFVKDKAATPNEAVATRLQLTVDNGSSVTNNLTATPTEVVPGVVQFAFDALLTNAALNRENFTINGAALPAGTELFFYGNKQTVRAKLPAGAVSVNGNRTLAVKNIVDENGNTLDNASIQGTVVALTENVTPTAQSASLQSGTVLAVEMSEAIASPAGATGVEVYVNGVKIDTAANALTFGQAAGARGANSQLTITATNATTFAPGQTVVVKFVEGSSVADTNGNKVAAHQVTVSN